VEGNSTRAGEIIQVIQAQHMQEPGIEEQFFSLLVQLGIINPDGTPATPAAAPASSPGEIWTPDAVSSNSEAGQTGDKKPTIWVPGMD
jgi:hypothetical protein